MALDIWEDQHVLDAVIDALGDVRQAGPQDHHFGRPWMTAYQLAMKVDAAHPEIAQALGYTIGGQGTGSQVSLAQYLARELSQGIARAGQADEDYEVEGGFLSNEYVTALTYNGPAGPITSSLTGTQYDLSMFRLRP